MAMVAAEKGLLLRRHLSILPGYIGGAHELVNVAVRTLVMENHKCEGEGVCKCWIAIIRISQVHRIKPERDQTWWIILDGCRAGYFGYNRIDRRPVEPEFD